MTRMMYNWILRRKLDPREDANGGIRNFIRRTKGMHVFIGNFTYIIDFMIVKDISSIIDPRMSQVVLGRPFVEISNMTHDLPEGVVRFIRGANKVAYKMPHKIEQYDLLSDLEKEHTKSVYLRNEEDMRRGVEYFSFGRHLDELHVTWAHLEKKRMRLRTNTKTLEDLYLQSLKTASQAIHDAVTPHQGRLPTVKLTPDENELGLDWWISRRAYFAGRISEAARIPRHDMNVGPVRQAKKGPIIVGQHYGFSELSGFPQGGPSCFPTQANSSFFEDASHSATLNWQTPIPSHPHDVGFFNPNILNQERREVHSSIYRRTPYMDLPPTIVLPKKHGDKTKNKGKNANVSALNLENAFADDNVGGDDVMIMGKCETGNYFMYEDVDPSKVRREDYIDSTEFMLNPYDVYLDCRMMGIE
ncbi:hypothetical protein Tco_0282905, partial [Tanacetum coccineum]